MPPKRIFESGDYDKFVLHEMNRDVRKTRELRKKMTTFGWRDCYPMWCVKNKRGKLVVIDGHHRFDIAKELGIKVKWVEEEDDGSNPTDTIGTSRNWDIQDLAVSHARSGKEAYIELLEFHEQYKLPLSICRALLGGETSATGNQQEIFKDGDYTIRSREVAETVVEIVNHACSCGVDFAKQQSFCSAIARFVVLGKEYFDADRMMAKIKAHSSLLEKGADVESMSLSLENVYNRKVRADEKVNIAFLARQAAIARRKR